MQRFPVRIQRIDALRGVELHRVQFAAERDVTHAHGDDDVVAFRPEFDFARRLAQEGSSRRLHVHDRGYVVVDQGRGIARKLARPFEGRVDVRERHFASAEGRQILGVQIGRSRGSGDHGHFVLLAEVHERLGKRLGCALDHFPALGQRERREVVFDRNVRQRLRGGNEEKGDEDGEKGFGHGRKRR